MSDTSRGPGWWLASDGKWYPPEAWAGPPPSTGGAPYPSYGAPGSFPFQGVPYQGVPYGPPKTTNGLAVASLVCSCAGIIPFLIAIPCVLGIVFGFVARSQIRRSGGTQGGDGLALAGIIVGFSLVAIGVIVVILVAVFAQNQACDNFSTYPCSVH